MCDDTQKLRKLCSIEDAVVYLSLDSDNDFSNTHGAPNEDDGDSDAGGDVGVDER